MSKHAWLSVVVLTALFASTAARGDTVWREYTTSYASPVNSVTDASAPAGAGDIVGVRVVDGTVRFESGNTYSGGTEIQDGVVQVTTAAAFGTGSLSLAGGTMYANGNYTIDNAVSLDGDFSFGYTGGSSWPGDLTFSQQLQLGGDYALIHNGSRNTGSYQAPVTFAGGVGDGGNFRDLVIKSGVTDPATIRDDGFSLGSGSTYNGATIVHGTSLTLIGSLASTYEVQTNNGGSFGFGWTSSGANDRLADSVPVYLRGGKLFASVYQGGGSQWGSSETVGNAKLDYGDSAIQTSATRARVDMTIANLIRDTGSTAFFYRYAGSQTASYSVYGYGRIFVSGLSDGFVGGWAVAQRDEYLSGTRQDSGIDFAWYDTTNANTKLQGVVPMSVAGVARTASLAAGGHLDAAAGETLGGNASVDTVRASASLTHDLGGYLLNIAGGGLLVTGGDYLISNGQLTSSSGELALLGYGSSLTVSADITGHIVLATRGAVTLSGNNALGDLYVNTGTLTLSGANVFASTAQVAPGAVMKVSSVDALGGSLDVALLFDGEEYGRLNLLTDVTVSGLYLNGVAQTDGTWGATGSGADNINDQYFTGTGVLTVSAAPVPEPTTLGLLAIGGLALGGLTFRRRRRVSLG